MYDHCCTPTIEVQGHIYHEKLYHSSTEDTIHLETQALSENMSTQAHPANQRRLKEDTNRISRTSCAQTMTNQIARITPAHSYNTTITHILSFPDEGPPAETLERDIYLTITIDTGRTARNVDSEQ